MSVSTLVLSTVPHCNLMCTYCQNEQPFKHYSQTPMSLDLFREIVNDYQEIIEREHLSPILRFCFTGGEPLIAGMSYLIKIVEIQRQVIKNDIRVENTLQTNGTLINNQYASLLKEIGFSVSVTVDGPAGIHNIQRPMRNKSKESLRETLCGISHLQQHNVPYGTLTVVSKNSLGHASDILNQLVSLKPNMMGFLPCVDNGPNLVPGEFGRFMIDLYDSWIALDDHSYPIREFVHIIKGMLDIPHTIGCQYAGICPNHINIAPDGKISVCDQYIGKTVGYLGDLSEKSLSEIVKSKPYLKFRMKTSKLPKNCEQCKYLALCNGGCAYRREPDNALDYLCEDRLMLFEHIEDNLGSKITAMCEVAGQKGYC